MTRRLSLYNSLAKTLNVWRVKMNFISNRSLNDGTFSRLKRFLTPYKTRDMKIQNFPSRNRQKNRLSHKTRRLSLYNSLAKTLNVWRVKMNFISNKSLNDGTFSRLKRFLTPYKTRDMKIQNFPSRNRQKNRLSHKTRRLSLYNSLAKTLNVWRVKMNFISNKSLNDGTFSRLKRFLMPYKTRDIKIQNFPSRNRQKNRLSHMTCRLSLLQFARKNSSCLARQNNFISNKSVNDETLYRFKRSLKGTQSAL